MQKTSAMLCDQITSEEGCMSPSEAVAAVLNFEKKINDHDVDGVVGSFTPDGGFVDSLGNVIGMDRMQAAWTAYFRMVSFDLRLVALLPHAATDFMPKAEGSHERKSPPGFSRVAFRLDDRTRRGDACWRSKGHGSYMSSDDRSEE